MGFYKDADPEAAISDLETAESACVVPVPDDVQDEKFVDVVIGRMSLVQQSGWGDDEHFYVAVQHLPAELVVNRPSVANPPELKKMLKEANKYVFYPWA